MMQRILVIIFIALLAACAAQPVISFPALDAGASASASAQANKLLIENFYRAFQQRDAETMANSYTADARFSDPAFTDLHGQQVGDMWRMLIGRSKNFSMVFDGVQADAQTGEAHWVATYTFSQTGRTVVNDVHTHFLFRDGKIAVHNDRWDLWHWSAQALGLKGTLLGWTPLVQGKIHALASKELAEYEAKLGR